MPNSLKKASSHTKPTEKFEMRETNSGDCKKQKMGRHFWEIENQTVVVVPSLSFDQHELATVPGICHYEERMLYALLALAAPETRVIFVTSTPLDFGIIEYYISLLPADKRESALNRLSLLSVCSSSRNSCLSEKILQHPRLLARMRQTIKGRNATLNVLIGTEHEVRLADELQLPLYAASPEHQIHGTKAGSRSIFRRLGIPTVDGTFEACKDEIDLAKQIVQVCKYHPEATRGVVKLAEGFSGKGNAIVSLKNVQNAIETTNEEVSSAVRALEEMTFCCHDRTWDEFRKELRLMGATFELFVEGASSSPSVQVVVNEDLSVDVLSTHEQLLDGQVYVGCRFPADDSYRLALIDYGRRVGEYFANMGIIDHFSVDFMCVPNTQEWKLYAIEINLRITGTTHPWMTMKLLTGGHIDKETGLFFVDNIPKYYVASDNVVDNKLRHLVPEDVTEIFGSMPKYSWSSIRNTGVVFHMLGCLSDDGKIGVTSIANSPSEAKQQFHGAVEYLLGAA